MAKLKYKLTNDGLFKLLFVKYPHLLKRLVAELLRIPYESIGDFRITNPEMQPETLGDKFCRLDINMVVDGRHIDLEVQVEDERDYVERSVFYLAREFSTAIPEAGDYVNLPPSIVISILAFRLFDCAEFHSEFQLLEVTRHEALTDKMTLHYFELPKIPEKVSKDDGLLLWLSLFRSETEEDIQKIQKMGGAIMEQVIEAYRHVSASSELKEIERMRERARYNEAAALNRRERETKLKTSKEIAMSLKTRGMDVDEIAIITKLTVDDVLRL